MLILLKRTKIFLLDKNGKEQRFMAGPGGPTKAPDWIRHTGTFDAGVADGSIIAVEPIKPKPTAVVAEPEPADDGEAEEEEPEPVAATPAASRSRAARGLQAGR